MMTARQRNFRVSEEEAERLLREHRQAVERADDIYELFYDRDPDQDIFINVDWPDDQILVGRATAIGYRSDKWNEGVMTDYIHRHDKPYPRVLMQRPFDDHGNESLADMMQQRRTNKPLKPPRDPVFAQLGHALDVEFIRDGIVQQMDWKEDDELPILAADLTRNILVICPMDGGYPVLLTSPIMKITSGGIES